MSASDSFADLWNSTAPSTTKPAAQKQPTTLGAPSIQPKRAPQKQDVFALLSASGNGSGSTTPATRSRPITPLLSQPTSTAGAKQKGASAGGDAFSSLFSGTPLNGTGRGGSMTIAERAANVEEERRARYAQSQQKVKPVESAWEGLDTLAGRGGAARKTTVAVEDEWGLGLGAATSASSAPPKDDDDWGLGEFGSPATTTSTPATTKPSNAAIWELDEFADPPTSDSLLATHTTHEEDDILGVLGAPATPSPQPEPTPSPLSRSPAPPQRSTPNRSSSPPPHILGQIVEMGFSVQQARVALAATDTGVDVQSALDMLLSNTASTPEQKRASPAPAPPRAPRGASARARAREQGEQERERERERERDTAKEQERNLQEQADKLLAQASEIGLSVFNRAGAFWREGREKVQKAYEERVGVTPPVDGAQSSKQVPAKPKWMTEAVDLEPDAEAHGFSDEVNPTPSMPRKKAQPPRPKKAPSPPPEIDLFSSEPTAYVSPFRRARPSGSTPGPSTPPTHATPRASTPSAPSLPPNPPVSQTALLNAQRHRSAGTAHFKLGQHAAAESAYTAAIDCLPAGHRALVPLYNNRALARLRTGEHRGAAEDAGCVLALFDTAGVGTRAGPGARRGADGTAVKGGEEDDAWEWSDAMVKALKRRAEALEGRERWSEARADWEVLAGAAWAGERARGEGVRGVGRCRKMAGGEGEAGTDGPAVTPKSTPKPKPRPKPAATTGLAPPSTALKTLRQASSAQEAEDTERARLKDRVDSTILAWKAGKETNIRALLAGLGVVLWPALGVEPCGMHELVSSKQVKVRYMRVIGRLHPDKLNAGNATLEQRMIANAVFGILNEAWNAFKQ